MPQLDKASVLSRWIILSLAFALSVLVGVFTVGFAKEAGTPKQAKESPIRLVDFDTEIVADNVLKIVDLEPIKQLDLATLVPIDAETKSDVSQDLVATPTPVARTTQSTITVARREPASKILIPGSDTISQAINSAIQQGIRPEDFSSATLISVLTETTNDLPLTIDEAVKLSNKGIATAGRQQIPLVAKVAPSIGERRESVQNTIVPGMDETSLSIADAARAAKEDVVDAIARRQFVLPKVDAKSSDGVILIEDLFRKTETLSVPPTPTIDLSTVEPKRPKAGPSGDTQSKPDGVPKVASTNRIEQSLPKATMRNPASSSPTLLPQTKSITAGGDLSPSDPGDPTRESIRALPTAPLAEATPNAKPVESVPPIQYRVPREPDVRITRQMAALQPRIANTIRFYWNKPLNTKDDSAWSIMHSILGYGQNGMVAINGKKGRRTNAVSWMCSNNPCANYQLLFLDRGYIRGLEGPGFQGHPAQFLAMLAQIDLRRDYPIQVNGYNLKVEDMVNSEMFTCSAKRELTFKLISLSHYLHSDAKWKNEDGEVWSIPKMLEIELAQPVNGAACGGTHRVMSIACALRNKERRGEPIDGAYLRAQQYVRDYQRYTMTLQNKDGSFSSDWFKRRSDWGDKDRQLQTTGHLLEWMVYSLPRNELSDPRIVKSVSFLTTLMTRHRFRDWEVGPRGHALRALALYHKRVFEPQPTSIPVARLGSLPSEITTIR